MRRLVAALLIVSGGLFITPERIQAQELTPSDVREIAKEAYIYGFPMVDEYRILHAYFVNKQSPAYLGPINQLANIARVYTPADTTVQSPNSDTPYSFIWMDLRAEPMVLTVPPIEAGRYFSIQLIDAYTFNFDYIGSRTTGNDGGYYMIAGPDWTGELPKGVTKVFTSETNFVSALYRTQLFNPDDLKNVMQIQAGYKAEPLSTFLGTTAPPTAPAVDFKAALTPEDEKTSLEFFNILNFVLQFGPVDSTEADLMARFAKIGVGGGKEIDVASLTPDIAGAMQQGMADAWAEFAAFKNSEFDTGKVTAGDVFGTREYLKNNYLFRMSGAVLGINGNSKEEAMYPAYPVDSEGSPLDGSKAYTLHFAKGELPPVNAFWSLTMYELPKSLLVDNPINRYLLNSPMLPQFKTDADGGITFYVQNQSPGADKESNWLPAPKGPFVVFMRLYWPQAAALDGSWSKPPMVVGPGE